MTVGEGLRQPSSMDTHRSHEGQSVTAGSGSQELKSDSRKAENSEIRRKLKPETRVIRLVFVGPFDNVVVQDISL